MSPAKEKEAFDYVPKEQVEVVISKDEKVYVEVKADDNAEKLLKGLE